MRDIKREFFEHALLTVKNGEDIAETITPKKLEILHSSHDLSEEVGELQNAIKRHVFYNQKPDVENIVEEFGDILCNIHKLSVHLGITYDLIYSSAIDKIEKRYPKGYSDSEAKLRRDKL